MGVVGVGLIVENKMTEFSRRAFSFPFHSHGKKGEGCGWVWANM